MQANTVKCIICKRWYSGVRGNLSLVVGRFRCKRCDDTIHEADLAVETWFKKHMEV